jgi:hypothetical protein
MKIQKLLQDLETISARIGDCNKLVDGLKSKINEYFSENLQRDETPEGARKRFKIKEELLAFANR